jgi:hypothetical protein
MVPTLPDALPPDTLARPFRRIAVIGDVGGHLDELQTELSRLGADGSASWLPTDLLVIQVGDLVHRGPDSDGVVALVDGYLTHAPGQWIQLVGNHEAHYLRHPAFEWPERIGAEAISTLRRWWATDQMQVAASVITETEEFLVTHAGVTSDFWRDVLGSPAGAEQAALALNALPGTQDRQLFRPGHMLGGRTGHRAVGPIWAAAATELVPSWLGTRMPFSQVHGHTSVVDWTTGTVGATSEIVRRTTADPERKHEIVALDGGRVIGVDPGHGRDARRPWEAFELLALS